MDFRQITENAEKHITPKSEIAIFNRKNCHGVGTTNSPFRTMPSFSTPPSRFARIINPFDSHLIDRLHLPTFSPNVFAQTSSPNVEHKFKWTIEEIANLKPAEIDESTISQHVFNSDDPKLDLVVQEKIETFFCEKEIVPSPLHIKPSTVSSLKDYIVEEKHSLHQSFSKNGKSENSTQTLLALPPVLPSSLEEALKPYLSQDCQSNEDNLRNNSLYKKLFDYEDNFDESSHNLQDGVSSHSSPALSTGFSPISFSPSKKDFGSPFDKIQFADCNLSPISKSSSTSDSKMCRSACRLNFQDNMSVDASFIVPDIQCLQSSSSCEIDTDISPLPRTVEPVLETTLNWNMEYSQISLGSTSADSDQMDVSTSNTPHSRMFTGQRKRLSESFKTEELKTEDLIKESAPLCRSKTFRSDLTDTGYCTSETGEYPSNVFSSTPSKRNSDIYF
ncbi:uncharacterized protein LOC115878079 [Sitophilus oryzae]|uniref:Protein aurora borealis n=1 Tax=Sitophilus oryzae TaxID=7048 RepID=A0A6J2XG91_SITOR|nr:uncharacterized protein LOC115878079 [Sitophilus oryzae]